MDRELNQMLSSSSGDEKSTTTTTARSSSSSPSPLSSSSRSIALWSPTCDVTETEKEVIVHAELAGVQKEGINLELHDNVLTISGERNYEKREEKEKWHRTERSFGRFERSMMVPDGVTQDQIRAKFDNGVLEVSFPKPEPKKEVVKKIKIN